VNKARGLRHHSGDPVNVIPLDVVRDSLETIGFDGSLESHYALVQENLFNSSLPSLSQKAIALPRAWLIFALWNLCIIGGELLNYLPKLTNSIDDALGHPWWPLEWQSNLATPSLKCHSLAIQCGLFACFAEHHQEDNIVREYDNLAAGCFGDKPLRDGIAPAVVK
jgi:hypothetical protein